MVNRIGTVYPCDSNEGFSLRFCVDSRVKHETPEEGRKMYWLKYHDYNNKDEVNSLNILSHNNYQASSQKFRQTILFIGLWNQFKMDFLTSAHFNEIILF